MPSKSYIDFLELLHDVELLRLTHIHYSKGLKGKKNLGYLTRSAIIMLCAAWERYNENLLLETIDIILQTNIVAQNLPKHTKQYLSEKVKENKNNIYPIELADNGWKNLWKGYAINETDALNTPNPDKLNTLYKRLLGIEDYTSFWTKNSTIEISNFIKIRGEIAHNGSKSKYVRFGSLLKFIDLVIDNTMEIDYNMYKLLDNTFNIKNSWDITYYRTRSRYK